MSQMQIKFISAGFKQILMSGGVKNMLQKEADAIKARASSNAVSGDFESHTWVGGYGGGRYIASVSTVNEDAAKAEAEDKALSKAVK